jgi:hypothetical protein
MAVTGERLRKWNTFLWIAASAQFALVYTLNTSPFLNMHFFALGLLEKPFQYRALTALLLRLAEHIHFPVAFVSKLPPRMNSPDDFVILGLAFFSMLVAVYATRKTLETLMGKGESSRWWALLVIYMAYFHYLLDFGHPCCTPFQLPYDLPSMAFFAIGLCLIVRRKTAWLYLLVAVAMFNRESAVFLVGIYFLYEVGARRDQDKPIWDVFLQALALLIVCLLVMRGVHHLFPLVAARKRTLGPFEIHVVDNVGYLMRPYYWASYLSMFGFSWIYLYRYWGSIPNRGIRYAMTIGPAMLAAMYVVGVLSEIRIFGELIGLFVVALSLLLEKQFSISDIHPTA